MALTGRFGYNPTVMSGGNPTIRTSAVAGLEAVSAVGLTAFIAVLHLAVLTAELSHRSGTRRSAVFLIWREAGVPVIDRTCASAACDSNPHRTFYVGRLALTAGLAIIQLAAWINVLRVSALPGNQA